jgi:hypothetical protein
MFGLQELLFIVVGVLGTTFWLWMLIDCAIKESNEGNTKVVWIIVIAFAHIIGAVAYSLVRRPQRFAELGR